jgi:virulence-associated protein VagC
MAQIAKLFWSGRSQAVRLPKQYRIEGEQVEIEKKGDVIILRPFDKDWSDTIFQGLLPKNRSEKGFFREILS